MGEEAGPAVEALFFLVELEEMGTELGLGWRAGGGGGVGGGVGGGIGVGDGGHGLGDEQLLELALDDTALAADGETDVGEGGAVGTGDGDITVVVEVAVVVERSFLVLHRGLGGLGEAGRVRRARSKE